VQLLHALTKGKDASAVAGLAFKKDGAVVVTGRRERIGHLDELPWPKRSRRFLDVAKQYQIAYPPPGKQVRLAQVMYSRGCPFSCSFCSSENAWGRVVAWRSRQAVLDEIEWLVHEFGTNLVYFPDLTFNVDRNRVLALCQEFSRRKPPVHWWALFRADLLDEELLEALREAGCVKISLGLESPNPVIAKTVKGSYEARLSQIRRNLVAADGLGFIIKAFLIIGFPEETSEAVAGYRDQLFDLPIDELRVTFATPFPGTRFFKECVSGGLIDKEPDWATFTTEAPVLRHPSIADDRLVALREELVTSFYLDNRYVCHATEKLARFPHLRASWLEYFSFLDGKGVFARKRDSLARLIDALRRVSEDVATARLQSSGGTRVPLFAGRAQHGDSAPG